MAPFYDAYLGNHHEFYNAERLIELAMALPGKSKRITVEPLTMPQPREVPASPSEPVKTPDKVPAGV